MEIPATTAGITAMVNNTGCALACHENDYTDSEYTVHYPGWGTIDSYTYAETTASPCASTMCAPPRKALCKRPTR